jgi:divalent metal cation (Fe/Co/Zn/Cd) transporter
MSLGICILNYIGSRNTNLGAAHTLLIDSIVDLIFPLISLVSLYYSNIFLDRILVFIQALIIFIMSTYFVAQKLIKYEEAQIESMRSLITMSISLILSLLCLQKTLTLGSITQNMSILITSSHFQIDVVLKICVILISVLHLFKIKNATKSLLILLLDLFGISYSFFLSGSNILKICQKE